MQDRLQVLQMRPDGQTESRSHHQTALSRGDKTPDLVTISDCSGELQWSADAIELRIAQQPFVPLQQPRRWERPRRVFLPLLVFLCMCSALLRIEHWPELRPILLQSVVLAPAGLQPTSDLGTPLRPQRLKTHNTRNHRTNNCSGCQ